MASHDEHEVYGGIMTRERIIATCLPLMLCLLLMTILPASSPAAGTSTATFSIVAYDPETQEWGVAVASRVLAVGYIVPWAEAGVGAIATQSLADVGYGVQGLELLEDGLTAQEVLDILLAKDPDRENRQVAIVDKDGNVANFTGTSCLAWAGNISGKYYSIQGNILAGENVVQEMEKAFLSTEGPLARRLLSALIAGDNAGGDSRGKQSSALLVVKEHGGYQGKFDRLVDIKVDDNLEPVKELERIYNLWEYNFIVEAYLDAKGDAEKEYALQIIDRVLSEQVENAEVYNSMAWALASRKLYPERAVEIAQKSLALSPEDANIMDTLAEAYYANGDFEKAVEWEKKALAKNPDNEYFQKQIEKFEQAK
jgi:uncharacterized Ntn-hydrolase superfamily protein